MLKRSTDGRFAAQIRDTKRCPKCCEPKKAAEFYRAKNGQLSSYCKLCSAINRAARYRSKGHLDLVVAGRLRARKYDSAAAVAKAAKWRQENPDRARLLRRIGEHVRRSRQQGQSLGAGQWIEILEVFAHRCAYCLTDSEKLTMDHVVAIARGGTNHPSNIVPACGRCNAVKNSRPVWAMVNHNGLS